MTTKDTLIENHVNEAPDDGNPDGEINASDPQDLSVKEQILILIAALKDSAMQELNYFKARTDYSLSMIVKGSIFFLVAFIFVLAAFIIVGIGLLLALKPLIGIFWATLLSMVIFLTLSFIMVWIGKSYLKKLSFPELNDASLTNDNDE